MTPRRRWRKLLEEEAETLEGGAGRRYGGAGWPHLAASGPPALRVPSRVFPCPNHDLFVVDKFHVYFAFESLFLAFLETDPAKYRICKTHGNCQFKP